MAGYGQIFDPLTGRRRSSLGEVVFDQYSDDSDRMTGEQFRSFCAHRGYLSDEVEVNAAFVRLDTNESGFIELREFLQWWRTEGFVGCDRATELKYQSAEEQKRTRLAHTSFLTSTGGLGRMTREQFRVECYLEGYAMSESELDEAMARLDKDRSDYVEFDEYLRWRLSDDRFAHLQHKDDEDEAAAYIHKVSKFFRQNDTELKGTLTLEQFKPLYKSLVEAGGVTYSLDDCIKDVDTNGDGLISLNEFLKWTSFLTSTGGLGRMTREQFQVECYREGYAMSESELDEAMARLDKDRSGYVEFDEYLRWRQSDDRFNHLPYKADEASAYVRKVSEFFRQNDTKLKGMLTLEQFKPLYESLFEAGDVEYSLDDCIKDVDTNRDGLISLNEFLKWNSDWFQTSSRPAAAAPAAPAAAAAAAPAAAAAAAAPPSTDTGVGCIIH